MNKNILKLISESDKPLSTGEITRFLMIDSKKVHQAFVKSIRKNKTQSEKTIVSTNRLFNKSKALND